MPNRQQFFDEQLAEKARAENKEYYGELVRRYQIKIAHYLRKFFVNPDELADVLQNVFIKAYLNLYDFNTNRRFSSWIYRIAHNEAINQLKKRRRDVISLEENEIEIIDEKGDLIKHTDKILAKEIVGKGLSALSEKYREPLILYFFEQKTYEEISDILRVPRSTVGTLIMRGKNILKNLIQKQYEKK